MWPRTSIDSYSIVAHDEMADGQILKIRFLFIGALKKEKETEKKEKDNQYMYKLKEAMAITIGPKWKREGNSEQIVNRFPLRGGLIENPLEVNL